MNKTALAFGLATVTSLISYSGQVSAMNFDAKTFISVEQEIDDKCRGESGDNPKTWVYCAIRDSLVNKLKSSGWCYGTDGQAEYQREWKPCEHLSSFNKSSYKFADLDKYSFLVTKQNKGHKYEIIAPINVEENYAETFIPGYNTGSVAKPPVTIKFEYDKLSQDQFEELHSSCPTPPIACVGHWYVTMVREENAGGFPGYTTVVSLDGWSR